jgi:predicted RNase H-like HicB family nuclease
MKTYVAAIEKCSETGLYVGYVPGLPSAHSQGQTMEELNENLKEVIDLIKEDNSEITQI